jgi:hypothetical protein
VHANLRAAKGAREVCLKSNNDKLLRQLHSSSGMGDNKGRANAMLREKLAMKNVVSANVIGHAVQSEFLN